MKQQYCCKLRKWSILNFITSTLIWLPKSKIVMRNRWLCIFHISSYETQYLVQLVWNKIKKENLFFYVAQSVMQCESSSICFRPENNVFNSIILPIDNILIDYVLITLLRPISIHEKIETVKRSGLNVISRYKGLQFLEIRGRIHYQDTAIREQSVSQQQRALWGSDIYSFCENWDNYFAKSLGFELRPESNPQIFNPMVHQLKYLEVGCEQLFKLSK